MQNNRQSSQHVAASDNLDEKVLANIKDLKFSLFIVNSSVTAVCLGLALLLNYPNI